MGYNLNLSYLNISTTAKFLSCVLLTSLADFLFFKQEVGWTAGLFVILLSAFYIIHTSPFHLTKRVQIVLLLITGQAFALIEDPNFLSCVLIIIGFIAIAYFRKPDFHCNTVKFLKFALAYIWKFWTRLFCDSSIFIKYTKKHSRISFKAGVFANSLLIIGLSAIFIMLFAYANPVLDGWLERIELPNVYELISVYRTVFWLGLASIIWAVIRPGKIQKNHTTNAITKFKPHNFLLTDTSISIALLVFNLIFLLQNLMDAEYLWMGEALPYGMTYAEYAHSGAYPLMATALLSIGFVLVILKPGRGVEQSALIRNLIYLWVAQNIFLVIGSFQRTLLYIDIYHLTLLRVSALIWMGLVATGLILIIARVAKERSNLWLINSNFVALIVTLYICSFVNFAGIMAEYNVDHAKEMNGSNINFDESAANYFNNIETLPALTKINKYGKLSEINISGSEMAPYSQKSRFIGYETQLLLKLRYQQQNWHSWTFRNYRIQQQIENMR